MTIYAQVTDGQIVRINVSARDARKGLVNFDGDYQAAGFWPITGDQPAYDPATQRISGPSYTADAGTQTVVRAWVVEERPLDEVKAEQQKMYADAVQRHLDARAQERNYDGILSACTYAGSTNPTFAAEGQACVAWRDAVWATCYAKLAEVEAGATPPTIEELIALLPSFTWPSV